MYALRQSAARGQAGMSNAPLEKEIRRLIAVAGPMPVARYMSLCLTHPQHGYYTTRDPLLAPAAISRRRRRSARSSVSCSGFWALSVWRMMGEPEQHSFGRNGAGRGTMMRDALRAAKVLLEIPRCALSVHMVGSQPDTGEGAAPLR